jgi:hypothetical protein
MGRAGSKSGKTNKKPQHLPKVGTPQEEHYELHQEQRAVMGNFGIHRKGAGYWIAVVLVVVIVAGGLLAWIFFT